jgi:hypothetical protein
MLGKFLILILQLNLYTMQKLLTLLSTVSVMALLTIGFSSCKDDENEPSNATLEFSTAAKTVAEGEQSVKANIVLDNPAPVDVIVEYEISGTATRKIGSATNGDFEIVGTVGEVEIAKGATSAEIELNILSDNSLESEETIISGDRRRKQLTVIDRNRGPNGDHH